MTPTLARDPKRPAQRGIFPYTARGKQRWGVEYRHPLTGRRTRKVGFHRQIDALAFRDRVEAQRHGFEEPDAAVKSLRGAVEEYVKHRLASGRNKRSFDKLRFWVERIGDVPVAEITTPMVRSTLDRMARDRNWSAQTHNNALWQLGGLFTWACQRVPPLCVRHPIAGGRVPTMRVENERERWLTDDELTRLVEAAPPYMKPLIRFAATTGLRRTEACELRVRDLRTDASGGAWLEIQRTKSGQPLRVPLESWVAQLVRSLCRGRPGSARIFTGPEGGGAHKAITRDFPAAVVAAGMVSGRDVPEGVTWHTLRHTFASRAIQAGLREVDVMSLGGWRDQRMLRRYAHLADESRRSAAAVVAKALRPKRSAKVSARSAKRATKAV